MDGMDIRNMILRPGTRLRRCQLVFLGSLPLQQALLARLWAWMRFGGLDLLLVILGSGDVGNELALVFTLTTYVQVRYLEPKYKGR
jgi:hypothetical protein